MDTRGRRVPRHGSDDGGRRQGRHGRPGRDGQGSRRDQVCDGALLGGIGVAAVATARGVVMTVVAVTGVMMVCGVLAGEARQCAVGQPAGADLQRKAGTDGRRHEPGRDHGPQQQRGCEGEEDLRPESSPHPNIIM